MWFDEAGEVVEMFRNSFPYSFLFFVPILIIISPVSPAAAASEFAVYRMQQYDLQGSAYGCRSAPISVEARPIDTPVYTRRCVLARFKDLTIDKYKDMLSQNVAGVVVLLPVDLSGLSPEDTEHLMELEQDLMQEESAVPVYFTTETPELTDIYTAVSSALTNDQASSAAEALMGSATANGYQMVVGGATVKALNDFQVVNLQGKLAGFGIEEQLPTIAVVAHYDSYGVAPSLSMGADSDASGVVALMEIARLFSKLYTNSRTHAKYNILFLVSGAGKFNYQGTKRWIDDQVESAEGSLLSEVQFVLCLDALGQGQGLHMHVSKPPKEGSSTDVFQQNLASAMVEHRGPSAEVEVVHKKINLAEDVLAWEHERFSMRRLPAFTLSHLQSHKHHSRHSITDTREKVDSRVLAVNTQVVAEALARHIFNISAQQPLDIFDQGLNVAPELVDAWLGHLTSQPRAAQILGKDAPLISELEHGLQRHLKEVKRHTWAADKRDPEFVFYSGWEYTLAAYNVKPAVFDLILAAAIGVYLAAFYLVSANIGLFYSTLEAIKGSTGVANGKVKRQ